MKVSVVAALAVVTPAVLASGGFESRDFDIKKALYGKIDKSLTSKLDFDGSYGSPCYKAVSCSMFTAAVLFLICAVSIQCKALQVLFDDSKWIMHEQASAYDAFTQSFWSAQQSSLDPSCIFKPSTATDVSIFVLISRITQCKFAVKGGGHAQYAGASSIQDGIAVSFEYMKEVTLSRDGKTAAVGPGNNWYEVYKKLENYNMTVIGARVSTIVLFIFAF
jgi:hypothetical protein